MMRDIEPEEFVKIRSDGDVLVDLRSDMLYDFGTIPGAIHISADNIGKLYELPADKTIYLFCQTGETSSAYAELLSDAGYNACNLKGGYREYLRQCLNDEGE